MATRKRVDTRLPSHLRLRIERIYPLQQRDDHACVYHEAPPIDLDSLLEEEIFSRQLLFFDNDRLNLEYHNLKMPLFHTYADEVNTHVNERLFGLCLFDDALMNGDNFIHGEEQFGAECLTAIIGKIGRVP